MIREEIKWCPQHGYPLPCYKCGYTGSGFDPSKIGEEIREGIEDIIGKYHSQVPFADGVPEILRFLQSQGVVIAVEGELPKSPDTDYLISQYEGEEATTEDVALMHLNGIEKGKSLMLNAGYRLTIPLI